MVLFSACTFAQDDVKRGIVWSEPPLVTPGNKLGDPPSDAVILFDGTDMAAWDKEIWHVENNTLTINPKSGSIKTKETFGSMQLHVEFATAQEVKGSGQSRSNSGVFIGPYEIQILDSYDNKTYFDGQCASVYRQRPPLVNVCRPPGEWQTLDIIFHRPEMKIEKGKLVELVRPGYITIFHNGVLVIDHHELEGGTTYDVSPEYKAHSPKLPIRLQDHGTPVKFRNIWLREIPDTTEKRDRQ